MKNKIFKSLFVSIIFLGLGAGVFGAVISTDSGLQSTLTNTNTTPSATTNGGSSSGSSYNCSITSKPKNIGELFEYAICLLGNIIVPFLISLGLVIFIAGVVKYVANGDNEEKREAGRGLMLFGIIALFVMVSVWGLVKIIYSSIFDGEFTTTALPKRATEPFR